MSVNQETNRERAKEQAKELKTLPEVTAENKALPEVTATEKPLPPFGDESNMVQLGDEVVEVKPTKLKYQRDRTAAFYRVLEVYPLPDIFAFEKGQLDPDRDGDKCLFDWLIAVLDDVELVKRHYESIDAEVIERLLKLFKKLNKIDEKEENAKNLRAKAMNR